MTFYIFSRNKFSSEEDNQSQYSYARELPGGGKKNYKKQQKSKQKQNELEKASNISIHSNPSKQQLPSPINDQKVPNGHATPNSHDDTKGFENTLSNPLYQNDPVSWVEVPKAKDSNYHGEVHTLPVTDLYARPDKLSKKKAGDSSSSKARMIPHTDESVSYTYYNRIVDDEFSFINSDLYSGHLGF